MARPSSKTAARVLRLREMHAAGGSDREIADAIGVHHSTVSAWRDELGRATNGAGGPRATRSRATLAAQASSDLRETARAAAAELAAPAETVSPSQGLEVVRGRLESVQSLIGRLSAEVEDDAYPATSWARLVELEAKLAATVAELTPPEAPDPEKDPANAAEADRVSRKLARLVAVAEAASRCCHCGRPPFAPASAGP